MKVNKSMNALIHFFKERIYSNIFIIAVMIVVGLTLGEWFIQNTRKTFWVDESLMFFMANHTPFTPLFYKALQSMPAVMPVPFIEYWIYAKVLQATVPLDVLMPELELYLRLPLTFYMATIIGLTFWMSRRLSNSYFIAGLFTLGLIVFNSLGGHLGAELRFHTSGLMHSVLSWFFLTVCLTTSVEKTKTRTCLFIVWTISALIASWSHVYTIYSVLIQLGILLLAEFRLLPQWNLDGINRFIKSIGFLIVYGAVICAGMFFKWVMLQPYARENEMQNNWLALNRGISELSQRVFEPSIWLWLVGVVIISGIALYREKKLADKLKVALLILIGLIQIIVILYLAMRYYRVGWGPDFWVARYTMAGIIPFIFCFSYLARNIIKPHWEKQFGIIPAAILLISFFYFPDINKSYWGNIKEVSISEKWQDVRHQVVKHKAYGKVNFVLGIQPTTSSSGQLDIHGSSVDHTWQLYTNGPFSIADFKTSYITQHAGRKPIGCKHRDKLPLAVEGGSQYAIDFCEKDKPILRVVKF